MTEKTTPSRRNALKKMLERRGPMSAASLGLEMRLTTRQVNYVISRDRAKNKTKNFNVYGWKKKAPASHSNPTLYAAGPGEDAVNRYEDQIEPPSLAPAPVLNALERVFGRRAAEVANAV